MPATTYSPTHFRVQYNRPSGRVAPVSPMNIRGSLILLTSLALFASACDRKESPVDDWRAGGLYSTANGNGKFGVVKILVLEPDAVHVRIYKQTFPTRPTSVDPKSLTLGQIDDKQGFSIGHLPLSRKTFASWQPVFLSQQSVLDSELEGYKMWKEGSGKTF